MSVKRVNIRWLDSGFDFDCFVKDCDEGYHENGCVNAMDDVFCNQIHLQPLIH